jgi:threonyl-tRNA synthetase
VEAELIGAFEFLNAVYLPFGFTYRVGLSTRNPAKWVGDLKVWDKAEATLREVLEKKVPGQWHINEEDAAFYGPKLDFQLTDALKRTWQCGTIQLDFNLPERFNLRYRTNDQSVTYEQPTTAAPVVDGAEQEFGKPEPLPAGFQRPVMIHRAILGSLERFIAIITENFGGKWPFWLSPRQVAVIPVRAAFNDYASKVTQTFHDAGLFAEADFSDNTLNKKIRNAQVAQWNFVMVVGEDEMSSGSVNIRNRDDSAPGRDKTIMLEEAVKLLVELKTSRDGENKLNIAA